MPLFVQPGMSPLLVVVVNAPISAASYRAVQVPLPRPPCTSAGPSTHVGFPNKAPPPKIFYLGHPPTSMTGQIPATLRPSADPLFIPYWQFLRLVLLLWPGHCLLPYGLSSQASCYTRPFSFSSSFFSSHSTHFSILHLLPFFHPRLLTIPPSQSNLPDRPM